MLVEIGFFFLENLGITFLVAASQAVTLGERLVRNSLNQWSL